MVYGKKAHIFNIARAAAMLTAAALYAKMVFAIQTTKDGAIKAHGLQ